MTKLSDTQAILLSAAAQRADGNLLPLPGSLRGGAAVKVVGALLARGLAREEVTDGRPAPTARSTPSGATRRTAAASCSRSPRRARGDRRRAAPTSPSGAADEPVDYRFNEGTNSAGEPAAAPGAPTAPADRRRSAAGRRRRPPQRRRAARRPRKTRDDTKQAQLIAMLRRKEGATIAQIVAATGWQPHTVRGAFAGALKKKLGLTVTSEKVEGKRAGLPPRLKASTGNQVIRPAAGRELGRSPSGRPCSASGETRRVQGC